MICLPIVTHRRWALGSTAVAAVALVAYAFGHYTAFPGFPLFVLTFLAWLILTIIAGVKANNGEAYRYPLTLRLVK